jgi:hypothetical protein
VAVERAVPAIPANRPTFPEPKLRTLELPLTEPFIGFKGSLNPATIADDDDSRAMTSVALATPRTDASPSAPPSPTFAATDVVRPSAVAVQRLDPPLEEFPGAVPVSVPRPCREPQMAPRYRGASASPDER